MKKIGILSILFSLLFLVSCEEEYADYTAPDELSDVSWYISFAPYVQNPFDISAGSFISFLDLSQGAVSHEWIIEEGNAFLNEGFKRNDSLPLFIKKDEGLSITDGKAHVLFNNNGLNNVRLLNKFTEFVSYNSSEGALEAYQEGDLWVIDTTFTFDVYGDLIPTFEVLQDGNKVLSISEGDMPSIDDKASWPIVEVEAGKSLTFVDLTTTDRPNGRLWTVPDGVPSKTGGESAIIKFFKLGEYEAGTFKSLRVDPLPKNDAEKLIPLIIKVIPSSEPFVLSGVIKEAEDESMSFQVSGEIVPFTGEEGNFTVNVKNEAAGFDQNIAVVSASVDSNDATFIKLKLAAPIYNSDVITVSYSGGNIKSTDTRDLVDFANKPVQMFSNGNILAPNSWSGFEVENGASNRGFAGPPGSFWVGANGSADDPNWTRTTEKAYSGDASMRFSVEGIGKQYNLHTYGLGTIDKIPAGTYKISFMVYLEEGNTMGGFYTWGDVVPINQSGAWDIEGLERGKWLKVEHVVTVPALDAKKKVTIVVHPNINQNASSGRQTMYFDDISFVELEVR